MTSNEMCVCMGRTSARPVPEKRVKVSLTAVPCVHVYTRVDTRAYHPRAISYRRPTDNSYLDEAVFLPILAGEERRVQGCAYAGLEVVKDRLLGIF